MNDTQNPDDEEVMTHDEKISQLREEKLSVLLAQEIQEEDKQWNHLEDCETQVKLDIADMILEELAIETANLLNEIENKRRGLAEPLN